MLDLIFFILMIFGSGLRIFRNRDTDREKAMMNLSQYRALYNLSIASIAVNKGHLLTIENHDQKE